MWYQWKYESNGEIINNGVKAESLNESSEIMKIMKIININNLKIIRQ